jgi:hypothetical protein
MVGAVRFGMDVSPKDFSERDLSLSSPVDHTAVKRSPKGAIGLNDAINGA